MEPPQEFRPFGASDYRTRSRNSHPTHFVKRGGTAPDEDFVKRSPSDQGSAIMLSVTRVEIAVAARHESEYHSSGSEKVCFCRIALTNMGLPETNPVYEGAIAA